MMQVYRCNEWGMNAARCAFGFYPRRKGRAGQSSSDGPTHIRGRIDAGVKFAEVSRLGVR